MANQQQKIDQESFDAYSISISAKVSWQLHALNNEKTEGNQSLTRQYYIVAHDDSELKYVNGLSGDMLKHIQAEHLHRIAKDEKLKLSEGGKRFHPDRINYDINQKLIQLKTNKHLVQIIEKLEKAKLKGNQSEINKVEDEINNLKREIEEKKEEKEKIEIDKKEQKKIINNKKKKSKSAKSAEEKSKLEKEIKELENEVEKFDSSLKEINDFLEEEFSLEESITKVIKICSLCDLEGFMVTEKGFSSLTRNSIIEFGTVVGIPSNVKTQNYFHAQYAEGEDPKIYNTQISSGLYATVLNIEAFRIGYNQLTFDYAIDKDSRKKRLDALLKSVLYTYLQPNGAKRNSNLPHIDHFEGVITISTSPCPSPMISSLNEDYREQIKAIAKSLNRMNKKEVIQIEEFNSMADFAEKIQELIEKVQPWGSSNAEEEAKTN